ILIVKEAKGGCPRVALKRLKDSFSNLQSRVLHLLVAPNPHLPVVCRQNVFGDSAHARKLLARYLVADPDGFELVLRRDVFATCLIKLGEHRLDASGLGRHMSPHSKAGSTPGEPECYSIQHLNATPFK